MKDYIQSNKKGLILVFIATLIMIGIFTLNKKDKLESIENQATVLDYSVPVIESKKEISKEERLELILNEYDNEITFFAKTFQIDKNVLLDNLRIDYEKLNLLDLQDNIGKVLINYLFELENTNAKLFNKDIIPCTSSKEYMVSLISYFSSLYGNVDFSIAAAIADVESNYTAPTMLKKNNIFGGMYSGGLIRYKNIEYGILNYIKLLSEGYFAKGLNTVETIGKVYNPTINENGVKVAKPTWVANVNKAVQNYQNNKVITNVKELVALQ